MLNWNNQTFYLEYRLEVCSFPLFKLHLSTTKQSSVCNIFFQFWLRVILEGLKQLPVLFILPLWSWILLLLDVSPNFWVHFKLQSTWKSTVLDNFQLSTSVLKLETCISNTHFLKPSKNNFVVIPWHISHREFIGGACFHFHLIGKILEN